MHIHWLQHVPFEGLGSIADWAERRGHTLSCTRLYAGDALPGQQDFDFLLVMGGPMGVHDESDFPWLKVEKDFLLEAIREDNGILGICLGAQLLATVLGAAVRDNGHREIGWFPVVRNPDLAEVISAFIPENQKVFHWHGDTFDIPEGALHLWSSAACRNQGFLFGRRILGLQFHLETTPESLAGLISNCGDELIEASWVQRAEDMISNTGCFAGINRSMAGILDYLAAGLEGPE